MPIDTVHLPRHNPGSHRFLYCSCPSLVLKVHTSSLPATTIPHALRPVKWVSFQIKGRSQIGQRILQTENSHQVIYAIPLDARLQIVYNGRCRFGFGSIRPTPHRNPPSGRVLCLWVHICTARCHYGARRKRYSSCSGVSIANWQCAPRTYCIASSGCTPFAISSAASAVPDRPCPA